MTMTPEYIQLKKDLLGLAIHNHGMFSYCNYPYSVLDMADLYMFYLEDDKEGVELKKKEIEEKHQEEIKQMIAKGGRHF